MSVRQDQEALLLLTSQAGASHIRQDQECLILLYPTIIRITTISGSFQDAMGNPISNGKITFLLSNDSHLNIGGLVITKSVSATLNSSGVIPAGVALWPNSFLSNSNNSSYYLATVYTASGQLIWSSTFQVTGTTFSLGTVTPNL